MSLSDLAPQMLAAVEDELRLAVGSEQRHRAAALRLRGVAAHSPAGVDQPDDLDEYYTMQAYHMGWTGAAVGGKRIRPLLCLLCCEAAGGRWRQALPIAAAIELVHNFSLIHDDIQDSSELRRGRPTVWMRWGAAQAINAGDAMFTLAHLAPHRLTEVGVGPDLALAALIELDYTCLALTQGQHLDMSFERRRTVSVAEYMRMIEKKTAALIAAATHLGARLAGASGPALDDFYEFGWNLGLAFQSQDDLLGIWGDPAVTGKSAASDLEQRKKSLPVVYGLEHSPEFAEAYAEPHRPGASILGLAESLEQLGARTYVELHAAQTTARARQALERLSLHSPAGLALRKVTDQLLNRAN